MITANNATEMALFTELLTHIKNKDSASATTQIKKIVAQMKTLSPEWITKALFEAQEAALKPVEEMLWEERQINNEIDLLRGALPGLITNPQKCLESKGPGHCRTLLMSAAKEGNLQRVKALHRLGANLNAIATVGGKTGLIYAAQAGHVAVVQYLLEEGADKDIKSSLGLTALMLIDKTKKSRGDNYIKIKNLLKDESPLANHQSNTANPAPQTNRNNGTHQSATKAPETITNGEPNTTNNNANTNHPNPTVQNNPAGLNTHTTSNAPVTSNAPQVPTENRAQEIPVTLLMQEIKENPTCTEAEAMKRVEKYKDMINTAITEEKITALDVAIHIHSLSFTKVLLLNGARIDQMDNMTKTPFYRALRLNVCTDILDVLTTYRRHLMLDEASNITALHVASVAGYINPIEYLLKKNIKLINEQTVTGMTALHYAVMHQRKDAIAILLASGANTTIKNAEGKTARDLATDEMRRLLDTPRLQLAEMQCQAAEKNVAHIKKHINELKESLKRMERTRDEKTQHLETCKKQISLLKEVTALEKQIEALHETPILINNNEVEKTDEASKDINKNMGDAPSLLNETPCNDKKKSTRVHIIYKGNNNESSAEQHSDSNKKQRMNLTGGL